VEYIFSLTSYPARYSYLPAILNSLRNQVLKPKNIIINIAENEKKSFRLNSYVGIEVNFVENLKAMKKLLPTLSLYPDQHIITVDDDTIYPTNLSQRLFDALEKNHGHVVAGRARKITKTNNEFNKYMEWTPLYDGHQSDKLVVPNGVGGVLYPPGIFHPDVLDGNVYREFITTDDFWWYAQARRNGAKFVQVPIFDRNNFPNIMPIASKGLFYYKNKKENDVAFKRLLDLYGNFVEA
jgi:protein O-GlcNAc transferase